MKKEYLKTAERRALLNAAVMEGDFLLASGQRATKKFEFDLIKPGSDLEKLCIDGLRRCISDQFLDEFDTIVTVANGANRLGDPLAEQFQAEHLASRKIKGERKGFYFDKENVLVDRRVLIVDDVFTRGTNASMIRRELEVLGARATGLAVICNRSENETPLLGDDVAVAYVLHEPM